MGLSIQGPILFFSPLHSRPKPNPKRRVDSWMPPHFFPQDFHAYNSYSHATISSKSLFLSLLLTLGQIQTHTPQLYSKILSRKLSPLLSILSRFKGFARRILHKKIIILGKLMLGSTLQTLGSIKNLFLTHMNS